MAFARFLYRNLKGYRLLIVIAIVLTFAEVGADIFNAFPLKFIIDKLANNIDPDFPGSQGLLAFFNHIFPLADGVIALSVAIIIVLGLIKALLGFVQLYLASRIAKNLTKRLSKQLFDHLQRLSITWHGANEQGDLVQRITGNMADLEKFVADGMVGSMAGTLTIVGVITVMLITNLPFTLISIVIVPLLALIVFIYTPSIKAATKKEKKLEGQVSNVATETMGKIMEIKAFTLENFMFGQFKSRADRKLEAGIRAGSLQAQFSPLVDIVLILGTVIIVSIGAYAIAINRDFSIGFLAFRKGAITLGILTVFLAYLTKLYQPMRDISKLMTLATGASAAAERIQEVMDQPIEILEVPADYAGPQRLRGEVNYEEVFFSYDMKSGIILKGVSLHIPAGNKVALVGLSGSGKTTLTNLLPRFYEVQAGWGGVKIDGVDVRYYPLSVLRQNISVVLQDSILFDGTIRENLKIGRPSATDAEMMRAAEQACIHETIMKKPNRYDERIINQGKNLSGGQRQRFAIARAILRDAPIIIMDEPTAALDVESEAEVMRALDGLAAGRTVLMITHRLSTVGKVDDIIVMKDGRIAEQGPYKKLKQNQGIFANLLKAQNADTLDPDLSLSIMQTASDPPDPLYSKAHVLIEVDGRIIDRRTLDKLVLTVGRMAENDVAITMSQQVSRLHAKILWKNNTWMIEDAESTNKLRYNGQVTEQHTFANEDRVYLAPNVALVYKQESKLPAPPIPTTNRIQARVAPPEPFAQPTVATYRIPYQKGMLVIEIDGKVTDTHKLDKETMTVGSLAGNDISIPSSFISRQHAQIQWERGAWVIKDGRSKNGLHYNGQRVPQHIFAHGDRVYLAPTIALLYQARP